MKKLRYCIYTLLLVSLAVGLASCGTDDNEKALGITKVYMPQAAMLDGGLTHNYPVPLNNNASTNNYTIDSTSTNYTLKIVLGVYRSGLQTLDAYSVTVAADTAATTTAVAGISKGIRLPSDTYTLPTTVSVPNGKRENTFYLEVDLKKLIAQYSSYASKKIVLVVGISNPTKYELNESLSKTTVIIDGASFMPAPKIVQGGDFGTGSEQYWTRVNLIGSLPSSAASINNGALVFDYGTTPVAAEICYYNTITLVNGTSYKFSCDFGSTGGSSVTNCRFYMAVSSVKPIVGTSYPWDTGQGSTCYSILDAWNGMKNAVNGTLPQNGGWQSGIDKTTGIFTSDFTGTGYLVFGVAAWTSGIGKITIDNVSIVEQ